MIRKTIVSITGLAVVFLMSISALAIDELPIV